MTPEPTLRGEAGMLRRTVLVLLLLAAVGLAAVQSERGAAPAGAQLDRERYDFLSCHSGVIYYPRSEPIAIAATTSTR